MKYILFGGAFLVAVFGGYLVGRSHTPQTAVPAKEESAHILYYVDPMHPAYKSDKAGIAPDCGMQLVPVYADGGDGSGAGSVDGAVRIDAIQEQLIGVKTAEVARGAGSEILQAIGKVVPDDSRVYRINSGVEGWVREASPASVGSFVHKDEKLASFYSPEFIALEQGYLVSTERSAATSKQLAAPGTQSTSARLRNYGMGDAQIAEIASTRLMPENVNITAPQEGFVLARNVAPGQRFERGVELYRLADLSHIWILAEVTESQAYNFRPGMSARVKVPGESRMLQARVSDVLPQFDPSSKTMQIRLEAGNPGYVLRPEMIVDLQVQVVRPAGLSVPIDALMDAGTEQHVYIEKSKGNFEPRAVTTGKRFGDRVEILQGLEAGEHVVIAGNFLLDSESRLRQTSTQRSDKTPGSATSMAGVSRHEPHLAKAMTAMSHSSGGRP